MSPTPGASGLIDLHTHSTASDGTVAPGVLVRRAAEQGVTVLGLTDHDTLAGHDQASAALPPGMVLVPGVEISCQVYEGDRLVSLHLLGYLPDPDDEPLSTALAALRASRADRAAAVVRALQADGHTGVTDQLVAEVAAGAPVGRPHLAAALVHAGLAADQQAAFGPDWLGPGGRYRLPKVDLPVMVAVRLVRAAGGVPVFAHPGAHRRGPTVSDETIVAMADAGLVGLEVDHPDHDPATRAQLRRLADQLKLLVTGSSDYHGSRKTTRLGQECTDPAVLEQLLDRAAWPPVRG